MATKTKAENTINLKSSKLLVIVESPNKVKHVQDYLRSAGYNVRVAASVGHIMELSDGGSYYNSGINPEKDFELNLNVSGDKHEVVTKLKAQAA